MERRAFLHAGLAFGVAGTHGLSPINRPDDIAHLNRNQAGPLRLSSNENPLGLCPAARDAVVAGIGEANRYPLSRRGELREAIASIHGVSPDSIVLGNGSTEVLQMVVQASATRRTKVIMGDPTFEDVSEYSLPEGALRIAVPLDMRQAHDVGRMQELVSRSWDPVLVYICNPSNPTGTITPSGEIDAWIESAPENVRFLIDEAYFEYVDDPDYHSSVPWIFDRPNVIVARTFSKVYGMAGLRLGYGLAHPDTAAYIRQYQVGVNVNEMALRAAFASLDDTELIPRSLAANSRGKQILCDCLDELGLEYLPSHTNFVMHRISGDLQTYINRMREHNIRVGRPFPPMLSFNRLSIGLPEEMERFVEVLRDFRRNGWV